MTIKCFEFNMFPVNTYVVWDDTKEAAIIDAGCFYEDEQEKLKKYIETNGLMVKHLLNTHLHLDHIFGNSFVAKEFDVSPSANKEDEFLLAKVGDYCRMFGIRLNEAPTPIGTYINDGDEIVLGNTVLKAIHVPGHSPGSTAYYSAEDNCAFCGDVLFRGSIGRTDLDGGDFGTLRNAITTKLFTLPDNTYIYTGHGDPTTIGNEKMNNPFFR